MYRTGDTLSAFGALQSFNEQVGKSFRVAAHSALELWGFNHYVPMGKPLLMVSTASDKMPQWMKHDIFDREFKFFQDRGVYQCTDNNFNILGLEAAYILP